MALSYDEVIAQLESAEELHTQLENAAETLYEALYGRRDAMIFYSYDYDGSVSFEYMRYSESEHISFPIRQLLNLTPERIEQIVAERKENERVAAEQRKEREAVQRRERDRREYERLQAIFDPSKQ